LKSEVYYSRNILIVEKTHDKKKEEAKPKISGEKNVSTNTFRVLIQESEGYRPANIFYFNAYTIC